MKKFSKPKAIFIATCFATGFVLFPTAATAGRLLTGQDIKDNTLTSVDIKDGTLKEKDLSPEALEALTPEPEVVEVQRAPLAVRVGFETNNGSQLSHAIYSSTNLITLDPSEPEIQTSSWEALGEILFRPILDNSSFQDSKSVNVECFVGIAEGTSKLDTTGTPDFVKTLEATKNTNRFISYNFSKEVSIERPSSTSFLQLACRIQQPVDGVTVYIQKVRPAMVKVEER